VRRHDRADNRALLVEVPNPFGRAWVRNIDLNELLKTNPAEGVRLLIQFVEAAKIAMAKSLEAGADGVLYRLHGANAAHCTPMEYSGHYLEHDRELLKGIGSAKANMIFLVGDTDLYFDLVSDLPAHLFGWDDRTSGISTAHGRAIRQGPVATFSDTADVQIHVNSPSVAHMVEKTRL
jgi:uroporphyrinogen-III decarboxylase